MTHRPIVRPLSAADDAEVRRLFDDTVLLGAAFTAPPAAFDAYRQLSLGWYLGAGRADAAVAEDASGVVVGYTLVCTDEDSAARFDRRGSAGLVRCVAVHALRGRLDADSRAFYRARVRDAAALLTTRRAPPAPVHAHLNVRRGARTFSVARALVEHVDTRCRLAGHARWYGEINEREGARAGGLERLGAEIVSAVPNHTLTRLLDEPVRRLTVVRHVPPHEFRPIGFGAE